MNNINRLIDANALKETIEFHPTSVSVCMTVAEAKGQTEFKNRCLDDIDNAPTIPAIPVEWMEQKRDSQSDPWDYLANAIDYILAVYKKEQEAQDGDTK